jgi:hypothetical protein
MALRNLRFPILISSGIVAAAGLVYYSHSPIDSEQMMGAIGKRDTSSAESGRVANLPPAINAILQEQDFKLLAKNPAFQSLLASEAFQSMAKEKAFVSLLGDSHFQQLNGKPAFLALAADMNFQRACAALARAGLPAQGEGAAAWQVSESQVNKLRFDLKNDPQFRAMSGDLDFNGLLRNAQFIEIAANPDFASVLASANFQAMVKLDAFIGLMADSHFQKALLQGSSGILAQAAMRSE